LNISIEGGFTTSLGKLFQCSVILTIKKFFCMLLWTLLPYLYTPPRRAWTHAFASQFPSDIYKHLSDPLSIFFSPG